MSDSCVRVVTCVFPSFVPLPPLCFLSASPPPPFIHSHALALSDSGTPHHAYVPRRAHCFISPYRSRHAARPPLSNLRPSAHVLRALLHTSKCVANFCIRFCVLIRCRRATFWRATQPTAFSQHYILYPLSTVTLVSIVLSHTQLPARRLVHFSKIIAGYSLLRSICIYITYQYHLSDTYVFRPAKKKIYLTNTFIA